MKTNSQCKTQSWIQSNQLLALPAALLLLLEVSATQLLAASADVDLSFDPGAAVNDIVNAVAIQSGGRTLIAGQFTLVHDAPFSYAAWLKADGGTDMTMQAGLYDDGHCWAPGVYAAALQADGKILLGGSFVATNQARNLVRLNADASVDSAFSAAALTAYGDLVDSLAVQSDGKIVLGGRHSYSNEAGPQTGKAA